MRRSDSPATRPFDRAARALVAAAAVAGLALVVTRARLVGFTYDEAYTWFHYVRAPLGVVLGFAGGAEANNHSLNSLLMTAASAVFGDSELALRLPNVLAFVGYAAAVAAIAGTLRHALARVATAALLLLNPFVIELFSMARGYGLALALSTGSLAALIARASPDRRTSRAVAAVALAGLAVVASLTFLDFFLAVFLVALVTALSGRESNGVAARRARVTALVAIGSPVAAWSALAIWRLRARGQLYYGGTNGFWADTVDSLVRCTLYLRDYGPAVGVVLRAAVIAAIGLAVWAAWRNAIRRPDGSRFEPLAMVLTILLLGCVLGVAAHVLFATPFRLNRTAVWILPVFFVLAGLVLDDALSSEPGIVQPAAAIFCAVIAVAAVFHFAVSANVRYAILQFHDADTKEAIGDFERAERSRRPAAKVSLFASWELRPSIDYYRVTRGLGWLTTPESPSGADAAFVSPKDAASLTGMRVEKKYPLTGNLLAGRSAGERHEDGAAPGPP